MARKKKKTVSEVPVEVTVAAVTVTDFDSSCCCGHGFQKQLCDLNVELGVERFCVEKEDSHVSTGAEATAKATELEAKTLTEAEATIGATAAAKEDCCCEFFRKLSIDLEKAYSHLERTDALEGLSEFLESYTCSARTGEEVEAAIEKATDGAVKNEAAVVNEAEDSCYCRDDLQKFWCEEYWKLGLGRRCVELRKFVENKESEENSGTVNHFKLIWHKDAVL